MAKGKEKRSSGANEGLQKSGASATESQPAEMPQFKDGAFAGLREKIEQRLNKQSISKGKKKDNKPQPSIETPKKDAPKSGKNQGSAQGKKRDRNGDVIAREQKGDKKKQDKPEGIKKSSNNDKLREEILALGGTEEDLDLLDGVDSESEVEGEKGGDEDLRKELAKMLESAGHVVPDDLDDEEAEAEQAEAEAEAAAEEEEEEGEEEDIEEADDGSEADSEDANEPEESDTEEAPPAKPIKAKETVVIPKEFAKLVSIVHSLLLRVIF
jgi:ribosome biogenesis protein MAK21